MVDFILNKPFSLEMLTPFMAYRVGTYLRFPWHKREGVLLLLDRTLVYRRLAPQASLVLILQLSRLKQTKLSIFLKDTMQVVLTGIPNQIFSISRLSLYHETTAPRSWQYIKHSNISAACLVLQHNL